MRGVCKATLAALLVVGFPVAAQAQAQEISQSQALEKAKACLVVPDTLKFVAMDKLGQDSCYRFEGAKQDICVYEKNGSLASFNFYETKKNNKAIAEPQLRKTALEFARRAVPTALVDRVRAQDTQPYNNGLEQGVRFSYSLVEGNMWLPQGFTVSVNRATGHVTHFFHYCLDVVHPLPRVLVSREKIISTYSRDRVATNPRGHRYGSPLFQSKIRRMRLFVGGLKPGQRENKIAWNVDIEGYSISVLSKSKLRGYKSLKTVAVNAQTGELLSTIIRRLSDVPVILNRPPGVPAPGEESTEMETTT